MNTLKIFRRKTAIVIATAAIFAAITWGIFPRVAHAQSAQAETGNMWTTGPIQLFEGQTARLGLVLKPATDLISPNRLFLMNSKGELVFGMTIPAEPAEAGGGKTKFIEFHVVRVPQTSSLPGWIVVMDLSTNAVTRVPTEDGVLIAMLLPAVQKTREATQPVPPIAGSLQVFDTTQNGGQTIIFTGLERN